MSEYDYSWTESSITLIWSLCKALKGTLGKRWIDFLQRCRILLALLGPRERSEKALTRIEIWLVASVSLQAGFRDTYNPSWFAFGMAPISLAWWCNSSLRLSFTVNFCQILMYLLASYSGSNFDTNDDDGRSKMNSTRWLSMERISNWLYNHSYSIFVTTTTMKADSSTSLRRWLVTYCVNGLIGIVCFTSNKLQGMTTLVKSKQNSYKI